jgi:penicillin-binding protein-related factor A (putative recombinase)
MSTSANRGKEAENLVKKRLEVLAKSANVAWHRPPDMRSGSFQPALCDFILLQEGQLTLIEVKQTAHDYRLPHGNLSTEQVGRMRVWEMAGARCYVLIYHSGIKQWRMEDVGYFSERTGGSWDLRPLATRRLEEILL